MCTVNISNHQVKQRNFHPVYISDFFLKGIVVARKCLSDVTFDICSSVHCRGCSDDFIWCFIAAVCNRPHSRGTEGKRPFHVISQLITSQLAGTCTGKTVFIPQDKNRLKKGR
jgi:hypothetical protein